MAFCNNCGAKFYEFPFHCRRCNEDFCSKCRLPEDHDCPGLIKKNIFLNLSKKKKHYYELDEKYRKEYVGIRHEHKKLNFYGRIKNYIESRYYKAKYWLTSRHNRRYSNWNAFFMNILWIIVLTFSFLIIFSNLSKLNEVVLWFLPLGGVLLLINSFFWIKFFWKLLKRIHYWYIGERNWVKYLIILLLIFFLWQGYQNKDTILDSVIEKYDRIDFGEILPLNLNMLLSNLNPKNIEGLDESEALTIQKLLYTPPERKEQSKEAFEYLNKYRESYGISKLIWDDRVYELAVFRSKDMYERNYFDHITPEGKCAEDFKNDFDIKEYGTFAENVGGMTHYENGDPVPKTSVKEAVDNWMTSRGHRYALLYPYADYKKSAIGCYKYICTFLVLTMANFECVHGDEGLAYWNSVGKQPGEI